MDFFLVCFSIAQKNYLSFYYTYIYIFITMQIYTFSGDFSPYLHTFSGDFFQQPHTFSGDFVVISTNLHQQREVHSNKMRIYAKYSEVWVEFYLNKLITDSTKQKT